MRRLQPVTIFFMLVYTLATLLLLWLLWSFVGALVLGAALASLFLPVQRFFERLLKRRQWAAGVTTGLLVVGVVAPMIALVISLTRQAYGIYLATREVRWREQLTTLLNGAWGDRTRQVAAVLGIETSPEGLAEAGAGLLKSVGLFIYSQLSGLAANTFSLVLDFCVMVMVVYVLFAEGGRLKRWLMELSPLPAEEEEALVLRFRLIGRAVFYGNGVASILLGVLSGVGVAAVGLGDGVFWGAVMTILAFFPVVGTSLVFLPVTGWLFLDGQTVLSLAFLAYNLACVGVIEYLLKPRLIGTQGEMNSIFALVAILGGLKLFGVMGLFYGPLVVAMFLALSELYLTRYRDDVLKTQGVSLVEAMGEALTPPVSADSSPGAEEEKGRGEALSAGQDTT